MRADQVSKRVDKQITAEAAAEALRKSIFIGCNFIGFSAAGYLIIMAFLTIQTGGVIHGY